MRFLDEQYGIRRDGNTLMIGSAAVIAGEKVDITIGGTRLGGTRGLWELLTRKNVNSDVITNSDLKHINAFRSTLTLIWRDRNPEATYKFLEELSTRR